MEGASGLDQALRLVDLPPMWVVVLVLLPALAAIAWISYRGESIPRPARAVLAALRFVALSTLLAVLFRPVMLERREEVHAPEVIVLVDDSASMLRKDAYGAAKGREALEELATPLALEETTRSALCSAALERTLLPALEKRGYVARAFAFAGEVSPLGRPLSLSGRGATTEIGSALHAGLAAHRGRHVTDVLIVSDGRQNAGSSASEAARAAAAAGIPVHTLVVGDTRRERNALIELVEAPESALEGDEISVTVRVLGRGAGAEESAHVVLEELRPSDGGEEGPATGEALAEAEATLSEGGERATLVARSGPSGGRIQERRFRLSVQPIPGETLLDDNALEVSVRIVPEKVRVLYVEGYPRWEYRFLKELLKRADENVQMQAFLLSATPDFPQESTRGAPSLRGVPTTREELLRDYDVVILGDVNPWTVSPDPAQAESFLRAIVGFVEGGGGLCFVAGEYDDPRAFVSTPLEDLLPVVLDAAELSAARSDATAEVRPRLDDPLHPHEIVRLLPDLEQNRRLWEDPEGLLGMYWFQRVSRAKPGSQVLLRHPADRNAHGPYPLLVAGYYPSGRTLFAAFDETWRWRYHFGDRFHERFWRNAVRWLALGRLKSGDRRYKLETGRSSILIGESATLEARVQDADFRPSDDPSRSVQWNGPDGKPSELVLPAVPGRPGIFRGTLAPRALGLHRAWIEAGGERVATAEFEVVLPSLERAEPAPDPSLLRELSVLSGGTALELARAGELLAQFPGGEERREPISSRLDDAWDTWATLLFALAVLTLEWVLRKRFELI